ncbi:MULTISPECIES: hypothetical protein [unclassified Moorena]|uniref:hypothetical protein n=1 Tax=unclassified Moorena TaxID=2683338 RepID=UPI0013CB8DDC|nr:MULTISPECIES: hypothetical protein [unclassified Moorena]NEP33775.1 hypothetical protein [Moorena sp. SIO3B2]NES40534.1 hypothetical protein [Moorena sp. SIO2C4]
MFISYNDKRVYPHGTNGYDTGVRIKVRGEKYISFKFPRLWEHLFFSHMSLLGIGKQQLCDRMAKLYVSLILNNGSLTPQQIQEIIDQVKDYEFDLAEEKRIISDQE